tara:strand:+ start:266 stop:967 length:702 start_codon:yes stop_codon:yes gene_type:complete
MQGEPKSISSIGRNATRTIVLGLSISLVVFFFPKNSFSANTNSLSGTWLIDKGAGDDVQEIVEDHLYKRKREYAGPKGSQPEPARDRSYGEISQSHYWETLNEGNLRKESKNLRRLGTAYPLLTAQNVTIEVTEQQLVDITYDKLLQRQVRPNPKGRIFSASGSELTNDTIGHTLTYWNDETLVLETDPPHSGKFIEKLKTIEGSEQLKYTISVRSIELKKPIEVVRIFKRIK